MQEAFEAFYVGFAASTVEILIVAAFVVLFFGALIIWARRRAREESRVRREHAEELYQQLREERELTHSEDDAIQVLSQYLNHPERKYVLLQSQSMFNAAAASALRDAAVSEGTVSALRVKLDYTDAASNRPPHSTADLPIGAAVLVGRKKQRTVKGRVLEPTQASFRIQTDQEERPFVFGTLVRVIYQNNIGIFAFSCAVEGFEDGVLALTHDEEPEQVQRRRYYRAELHLPVHVRATGRKDTPKESEFLDIGGGGASLINPAGEFEAGNTIELSFHPDSREPLHVQASVIRTSENGSVLHVRFEQMRESMRDKIYRLLFTKQR